MSSGELIISGATLIHVLIFLLYVPISFLSFRWLIPRLSPISRRLASGMLAAQILVILLALEVRPSSNFDKWLWNWINGEWNIPSTVATTQLALVIGVAFLGAWQAHARPACQRLYLFATGLVVAVFLLDEHLRIHEVVHGWIFVNIGLGAALAIVTVAVALRSTRRERISHICLLVGLGVAGFGAAVVDKQWSICGSFGFLRLDGCLLMYPLEESMEYIGIWLVLVAVLGHFSMDVPTPSKHVKRIIYSLPLIWLVIVLVYAFFPALELRLLAQPASMEFESGVYLRGYRMDTGGGSARLQLYASARQREYLGLGYSIHLVDQVGGETAASQDKWADLKHSIWFFGYDYMPVYRQSMEVVYTSQMRTNRALWIVLTLWRKKWDGSFHSQPVPASDHQLLGDTQVVLAELVLPAASTASSTVPLAVFDNGFTLEAVEMPDRARAGETIYIPFTWRSDIDGTEDYVQFLHFGYVAPPGEVESVEEGANAVSSAWWVYDQLPLGPRLPTRLWYSGLADSEVWQVPIPADLAPGRYHVFTGLYRLRDQERLPAIDTDGTYFVDARVPLGILTVE